MYRNPRVVRSTTAACLWSLGARDVGQRPYAAMHLDGTGQAS